MNSNGVSSPEEKHYEFDTSGRLREAVFAQSPQTGSGAPTIAPFYTANYPAASRAIAFYDFDGGGRQTNLQHGWQTWSGSAYNAIQCILANPCNYDLTRDLKVSSTYSVPATGNPMTWTTARTEEYSYDAALDYLTAANYGDGLANANPSWSYGAECNRTDSVCDNLNRTASVSGTSVACDILGNRTTFGSSATYSWDYVNRMTGLTSSGKTSSYEYRADGIRTRKMVGPVLTDYFHDEQMPVEEAVVSGSTVTATRYGLGVRGIDYEEVGTASTSSLPLSSFSNVGFPIYDVHGNMVATLARSGANGFAVNNQRSYDAWGLIRSGNTSGDPKNRYCGKLGHQQDDESGLIYMRARYYEATSGRFLSQDPGMQGANLFVYCGNNPIDRSDGSGKEWSENNQQWFNSFTALGFLCFFGVVSLICLQAPYGAPSATMLGFRSALYWRQRRPLALLTVLDRPRSQMMPRILWAWGSGPLESLQL